MSNVTFPPSLPAKFGKFVEMEIVDANTIRLKNKETGQEIGVITRTQLEAAVQSATTLPSKG